MDKLYLPRIGVLIVGIVTVWNALAASSALAQDEELKQGPEFLRTLRSGVAVTWRDQPLGSGLAELRRQFGVAIVLDRRVDPNQTVDLSGTKQSFADLIDEILESTKLEACATDSLIYIGPRGDASRLGERLHRLDGARLSANWKRRTPLDWERLTVPADGLRDLMQQRELTLTGLATLPHDLWNETKLPPTPTAHLTEILLAGFERQLRIEGDSAKIHPIEKERSGTAERKATYSKTYTLPSSIADGDAWLEDVLGRKLPSPSRQVRQRLIVECDSWRHTKIAAALLRKKSGRPAGNAAAGVSVFTVPRAKGQLRQLLPAFAQRLELQLKLSEEVTEKQLDQIVEVSVKDATRDELLDAVVEGTGLQQRVVGDQWIIEPKS